MHRDSQLPRRTKGGCESQSSEQDVRLISPGARFQSLICSAPCATVTDDFMKTGSGVKRNMFYMHKRESNYGRDNIHTAVAHARNTNVFSPTSSSVTPGFSRQLFFLKGLICEIQHQVIRLFLCGTSGAMTSTLRLCYTSVGFYNNGVACCNASVAFCNASVARCNANVSL